MENSSSQIELSLEPIKSKRRTRLNINRAYWAVSGRRQPCPRTTRSNCSLENSPGHRQRHIKHILGICLEGENSQSGVKTKVNAKCRAALCAIENQWCTACRAPHTAVDGSMESDHVQREEIESIHSKKSNERIREVVNDFALARRRLANPHMSLRIREDMSGFSKAFTDSQRHERFREDISGLVKLICKCAKTFVNPQSLFANALRHLQKP